MRTETESTAVPRLSLPNELARTRGRDVVDKCGVVQVTHRPEEAPHLRVAAVTARNKGLLGKRPPLVATHFGAGGMKTRI